MCMAIYVILYRGISLTFDVREISKLISPVLRGFFSGCSGFSPSVKINTKSTHFMTCYRHEVIATLSIQTYSSTGT